MNKQQVMEMMGLEILPQPSNSPVGKCIALVERVGGDKDYVIFANGGIVADKKPVSAVRKVVEYYPVVKEKKVVVVEEAKPEVVVEVKPEPLPEVVVEYNREEAIAFLVSNKMNEARMKEKTDEELKKLLKVYKR